MADLSEAQRAELRARVEREMDAALAMAVDEGRDVRLRQLMRQGAAEWAVIASELRARATQGQTHD